MAVEVSLVFIKPGNKKQAIEIIEFLEDRLRLSGNGSENYCFGRSMYVDIPHVPRKIIEKHYAHIPDEIKESVFKEFEDKGVLLAVYAGEGIIRKIREIVGDTDPLKAGRDTIRGVFSPEGESLEKALAQRRAVNNVIHSSAKSKKNREAEDEIRNWSHFLPYGEKGKVF